MKHDKTGQGWGHGDAIYACNVKRGNCTDFHSLFIAMARASGIPARFEIGYPLPEDKTKGEIAGYHCWAEFYIRGIGWIPIDASEAWLDPSKHNYFFGAVDANRVAFTMGRDPRLSPQQQAGPVNFIVYLYAEAGGQTVTGITSHVAFHEP